MKPALVTVLIVLATAAPSAAQEGAAERAPDAATDPACADGSARCAGDLDTGDIVVTGSRAESPADDSPARVEVIARADIERSGARDLGELLEEQPGVLVTRSFRGDEIQMEGLDPEHVLVLVNGDRVPGRIGGAIDLGRYSLEDVERIEIVRGASSAMYGSDAIGGVINVITRRTASDFEADASASGGGSLSNGGESGGAIADATARVAGRIGGLSLRLSGGFHVAEPFRRGSIEGVAIEDQPTAGSGRVQWSLGGGLRWEIDRSLAIEASAEYLQRALSGVDRSAGGAVFDRTQLAEQLAASAGMRWDLESGARLTFRASYATFREQYLADQRGSSALDDDQDNREHLSQLTFQLDAPIGDHLLSAGLEELTQVLESERLVSSGRRFRIAPFVEDTWFAIDSEDVRLVIVPGVRLDADSQFGTQLSPKLTVRLDPIPDVLVLRASYGSGFRAPSFQELLLRFENPSVGYVVEGNPQLGAETSRSVQAGVEWRPLRELRMSASYFRHDIEGLIAIVTREELSAGTIFSYANVASATTQGLESSILVRPIRELSIAAGYTFTSSWDDEAQRPLEGRAEHRITASSTLDVVAWELGATVRCALTGERPFFREGEASETIVEIAPWQAQLDLRVWKRFTRHLELSVGIDNVLDAGDAYLAIRPRTFYGGLRGRY